MSTPALRLQFRWRGWLSRHVLLLALVSLVPAFLLTRWVVGLYHATGHDLAAQWYAQGEADERAGREQDAIDDYRTALGYARDNVTYRLRLAQALARTGQLDPAAADLRRLWEEEPANSVVNLELARLAVRRHVPSDAVRYYNNAIYGVWPSSAADRRRDTQLELIDYLLANGRTDEARAGLIALAADAPPDPVLRLTLGRRMLRAGAEREALREFTEALDLDPASTDALASAGAVAFRLGHLADAQRYLRGAVDGGDRAPDTTRLLRTTTIALDLDPFERGLSSSERVRRIRAAMETATRSFGSVMQGIGPGRQPAFSAAASLHVRLVQVVALLAGTEARDAQTQQDAMDLAFDIEQFVASHHGVLTEPDEALLALERSRRGRP